ncbi:MAG: SCO2521 family protein [Actinocrinis sp.]
MRTEAVPSYPPSQRTAPPPAGLNLAVGEIRTGLLRNSAALPKSTVGELLDLVPGEPVRQSERPIAFALSPEVANGVDTQIPTAQGGRIRAVGTILTHAAVTGGRVLQTSSYTRVESSGAQRRAPWSHYTAKPGMIETISRAKPRDLAAGYLAFDNEPDCLDLGAVSERLARRTQGSAVLDGRQPLRFQWTRLRWAALYGSEPGAPEPAAHFELVDDTVRALSLWIPHPPTTPDGAVRLEAILELCRDLALHDFVLTTLTRRIERVDPGSGDRDRTVAELRPVIDHLLHLWMPGARVDDELAAVWDGFERRPGFTRQWDAAVGRVRDQLALHTLQLLATLSVRDGSGGETGP